MQMRKRISRNRVYIVAAVFHSHHTIDDAVKIGFHNVFHTYTLRVWNIYFKSSHTLLVHGLSNWYQRRNKKQNWKRRTVRYLYRLYVSPWITLTVILFVWNDSHLRQTISSVSSFYRQNKWGRKVKLIWYPNDIHTFFSIFCFCFFFWVNG